MRKHKFTTKEYYHVYNRGVDKRMLFEDESDVRRFIDTINYFNKEECYGGVYLEKQMEKSVKKFGHPMSKLVTIVTYCVLGNHFHFVLRQEVDAGISKFMQKFGNGYTKYFNTKHKRTGSLFQGRFKSRYIDSNEYLLRVFAYVSSNYKIHNKFGHPMSKFVVAADRCIFQPSISPIDYFEPNVVVEQFYSNVQLFGYLESVVKDTRENRGLSVDLE